MGDLATENYKKSVTKVIERWADRISKIGDDLAEVDAELAKLDAIKEPTPDDQKQIDALHKRHDKCVQQVENENLSLKTNLILLEPSKEADPKELAKLPDWMEKLIKAKGIPLGKGVAIRPSIGFDLKKKKLTSFGLTITFP